MEIDFIPLDYSYFDFEDKNYVKLIGRTSGGKRICVIDSYDANFWAVLKNDLSSPEIESLKKKIDSIQIDKAGRKTSVLKTELHDKKFLGRDVKAFKVFVTNHKDGHAVADNMGFPEIEKRREYDIHLITKYITEKKILPMHWHRVKGSVLNNSPDFGGIDKSFSEDLDILVIKAEKIEAIKEEKEKLYEPKILAYDIETDSFEIGEGRILMISLYGKDMKKVFTWKKCSKKQDYVECFADEKSMLEAFVSQVKKYDPDFLVGYFSDGFDLPYIRARAKQNKMKLELGLDDSEPVFSRGVMPSAKIAGIVHVDLYRFIETVYSQYMQSETLSLNEVASELIGEKKEEFDFSKLKKLDKMSEEEWKLFFSYNLKDSELTFRLADKIWPDMLEFSRIIQEPIYEIVRAGMSSNVENYILHHLSRFNEIAEKKPVHNDIGTRRAFGKYGGAFVFQPKPGLYENVVFFDFTSMYTSVAITYNLSLSSFSDVKKEKDSLEVDLGETKVYFSKQKAFFPLMLEEVMQKRKDAKQQYKINPESNLYKAKSNAYKLLANAAYGYQGFFGARYYCREAAASIAALAKKNILEVIEKIRKENYHVIYSDTDSICFSQGEKSKKEVLEMLSKINSELPGVMELELEDFYPRALFVSKRSKEEGAKKKYALIDEKGKLKIRGFETVRRDWCTLARNLQNEVLKSVLKDGNEKKALELLKKTVEKLNKRQVDMKELVIRTQLKKSISDYKASIPHVIAAKKMEERDIPVSEGTLIEYYIAEIPGNDKKTLVRDKVKLLDEKGDYDIKHYLERQVLPAVENILEVFGVDIKQVIDGNRQKKLF